MLVGVQEEALLREREGEMGERGEREGGKGREREGKKERRSGSKGFLITFQSLWKPDCISCPGFLQLRICY